MKSIDMPQIILMLKDFPKAGDLRSIRECTEILLDQFNYLVSLSLGIEVESVLRYGADDLDVKITWYRTNSIGFSYEELQSKLRDALLEAYEYYSKRVILLKSPVSHERLMWEARRDFKVAHPIRTKQHKRKGNSLPVYFRFWNHHVIALFPHTPEDKQDPNVARCYTEGKGWSRMSLEETILESREATPQEYEYTSRRLIKLGYKFFVLKVDLR